jgi:predicted ATPase
VQHALRTTGVEAAAGKSNKLQRDKPYDSVVEALRVLFNRLLSSGPGNIARARDDLHRALDGHARVIADLVAEAGHVLGPTAPLAEVPAYIALTRAQNAICRVLEFFATAARPWWCFSTICNGPMPLRWGHCRADQPRARSPCLIGAYRDGEEMTGELADLVTMARTKQDRLVEIAVQPLSLKQRPAISAALPGHIPQFAALTDAIFSRAAAESVFINQLLRSLLDARSIRFDPLSNTWSWQTDDATATGAAGDLSSFMVAKLENLPLQSRRLLRHMACIGRKADMHLLTQLMKTPLRRCSTRPWSCQPAACSRGWRCLHVCARPRVRGGLCPLVCRTEGPRAHTHCCVAVGRDARGTGNLLFEIAITSKRPIRYTFRRTSG